MSYFSRFPFVLDYKIQGKTYTGMDITRRTGIENKDQLNESSYLEYKVKNGETPIMLADRLYDDVDLYWVILMFNNIFDIHSDWPLDYISLDRYINRIYDDPYGIHHYQSLATGAIVDFENNPDYDTIPVTNYEHETKLNDEKREIKVPTPVYAREIARQHKRQIQQ